MKPPSFRAALRVPLAAACALAFAACSDHQPLAPVQSPSPSQPVLAAALTWVAAVVTAAALLPAAGAVILAAGVLAAAGTAVSVLLTGRSSAALPAARGDIGSWVHGALAALLPPDWELWLDGGHNPGAAAALARQLAGWADRPAHLVVGMKAGKDPGGFLHPLLPHAASVWAVREPGQHLGLPPGAIVAASGGVARVGPGVADALRALAGGPPARVLACGSLYLAGEVLKLDGTMPD